jgi:hypothetical protein
MACASTGSGTNRRDWKRGDPVAFARSPDHPLRLGDKMSGELIVGSIMVIGLAIGAAIGRVASVTWQGGGG